MAQDQRETGTDEASPPPAAPRLRAVACLGGVSLERGVPTGEIHDYIQETRQRRLGGRAGPGAGGAGHADRRVRPPPAGAGGRGPRPAPSEGGRVSRATLLLVTHAAVPGEDAEEPADHRGGPVHRPELSWSPSTEAASPALEAALARWTRGGPMLREGVGFLVYAVLDAIIDSFAPFLGRHRGARSRRRNSPCSPGRMRRACGACSG